MTQQTQVLASEILRRAKARIGTPETWGQGDDRKQECMVDAFKSVMLVDTGSEYQRVRTFLLLGTGCISIPQFNDTHTHAEVMDAFDRAIALAEREEAGR